MTITRKAKNRELIRMVSERLIQGITGHLREAGLQFRIATQQASTGSMYVKVRTEKRHKGAVVRISDHRKRHTDRWVNFSRPAKRFYGIWCFNNPARIEGKAQRIVAHIVRLHRKWGDA